MDQQPRGVICLRSRCFLPLTAAQWTKARRQWRSDEIPVTLDLPEESANNSSKEEPPTGRYSARLAGGHEAVDEAYVSKPHPDGTRSGKLGGKLRHRTSRAVPRS